MDTLNVRRIRSTDPDAARLVDVQPEHAPGPEPPPIQVDQLQSVAWLSAEGDQNRQFETPLAQLRAPRANFLLHVLLHCTAYGIECIWRSSVSLEQNARKHFRLQLNSC